MNYPARSAAGKKQRSQRPDLAGLMTVVPGGLGLPDRPAADQGRRRCGRRRADCRGRRIRDRGSGIRASRDLGNVALLPGLVNAHTHLELSWLRGRVPPASQFTDWVKTLFAIRGRPDAGMSAEQIAPIHEAIAEAAARRAPWRSATSATRWPRSGRCEQAGLDGVVFHELLGFKERDGALLESTRDAASARRRPPARACRWRRMRRIRRRSSCSGRSGRRSTRSPCPIMSVHLGESAEEVEFLEKGTGPWRGMLETIGAWRDDWQIPACDPVSYLDRHGVHRREDAGRPRRAVRRRGAGAAGGDRRDARDLPAQQSMGRRRRIRRSSGSIESGVAVAVGTDSLASVEDLNLFSELKTMRWLAPAVPAREDPRERDAGRRARAGPRRRARLVDAGQAR